MKDSKTVIKEFNDVVNMTATELEKWLKSDDSQSAGWPKENSEGESVGHDSGRKIVEILKSNPNKTPTKYSDSQIEHMRKVVSYCKRHLAQEEGANNRKPIDEVKKTKSYASLKNWGHDPVKKRLSSSQEEKDQVSDEDGEPQAGDKRKKSPQASGGKRTRKARKSEATDGVNDSDENEAESNASEEDEEDEEYEEDEDEDSDRKSNKEKKSKSKSKSSSQKGDTGKGPEVGDTVSWNWGNGQPQGKVLDVKEDDTTIKTKRGNEVSRKGDAEDPAVVLDTGKSKAIKLDHELN